MNAPEMKESAAGPLASTWKDPTDVIVEKDMSLSNKTMALSVMVSGRMEDRYENNMSITTMALSASQYCTNVSVLY